MHLITLLADAKEYDNPEAGLLIAQKYVATVKWAECRPLHGDQFVWLSYDSVLAVVLSR